MIRSCKKIVDIFIGSPQSRYEARHDLVVSLADRWQMRAYNRNLSWHKDDDFKKTWAQYPEKTNSIHDRKFVLHSIAKALRNTPGDLAECGVFRASSSFLMLSASQGTGKYLHGFDSFEGLSEPGKEDVVLNDVSFKWKKNDMSIHEDIARKNLANFKGSFTLYKGWIPERFHEVENRTFSLVHIDVDLYEPTYTALEFFWPRLAKGGMIVCDDYGFETCPGSRKAMDVFFNHLNMTVIHLTTGQGMVVKND